MRRNLFLIIVRFAIVFSTFLVVDYGKQNYLLLSGRLKNIYMRLGCDSFF